MRVSNPMQIQDIKISSKRPGYGSFSTLLNRPVLTITVLQGPDKGETARFDQPLITFGSGKHNDFVLNDQVVRENHGKFYRSDEGFLYHDHGKLKATLISLNGSEKAFHSTDQAGPTSFLKEGYIQIGASRLRIKVDWVYRSEHESGAFRIKLTKQEANEFMAVQKPDAALNEYREKDPRLEILFDLAARLNRLNRLDDILELIAKAAFDAFSTANIFSLSLLEGKDLRPIQVRVRDLELDQSPEVVLSRSVLSRVVETEEAVLFVRGDREIEPTQSMVLADISACMCAPLVGQRGLLGVMQVDTRSSGYRFSRNDLALFCVLASHAAFALERANLADEIYHMFERFVEASVSAIEARDDTTAGHSERVAKYSLALAEAVNQAQNKPFVELFFNPVELTELRYAALLHDFGKVGVREAVLMKEFRLSKDRMDTIIQRFRLFKAYYREKLTYAALRHAIKVGGAIPVETLCAIDEKVRVFAKDLSAECAFLEEVRMKWSLGLAEITRIEAFGRRQFETPDGELIQFLTEDEIENFVIRVGTLTEKEWTDMRTHVSQSEDYLRRIPWSEDLKQVPCIAGAHHEKLDGSGYPLGLSAEKISPRVRILTIADIFDAVTAWDRPYNIPLSVEKAKNLLRERAEAGKIDHDLVELFVNTVVPGVLHLVPVQQH